MPSANKSHRLLSAAATANPTMVKAGPAHVCQIQGHVARATPVYLKLYDDDTDPPVVGQTPRETILLPTGDFIFDMDVEFLDGLAYRMTTAAADADTGALTAGDITCFVIRYRSA